MQSTDNRADMWNWEPATYLEEAYGFDVEQEVASYLADVVDGDVTGEITRVRPPQTRSDDTYRVTFDATAEATEYGEVFSEFTYRFTAPADPEDFPEQVRNHKLYNLEYDDPAFGDAQQRLIDAFGPIVHAGDMLAGSPIMFGPDAE